MLSTRNLIVTLTMLATAGVAAPAAEAGEIRDGIEHLRGALRTVYRSHRERHRSHRIVETCRYIPGHHEDRARQVWIEGYTKRVQVPAKYREYRDACGRLHRELVRHAYVRNVWVPGHHEVRTVHAEGEGLVEERVVVHGGAFIQEAHILHQAPPDEWVEPMEVHRPRLSEKNFFVDGKLDKSLQGLGAWGAPGARQPFAAQGFELLGVDFDDGVDAFAGVVGPRSNEPIREKQQCANGDEMQ